MNGEKKDWKQVENRCGTVVHNSTESSGNRPKKSKLQHNGGAAADKQRTEVEQRLKRVGE